MTETLGALVIGGNYRSLSIARSLGRRGIPVWVMLPPHEPLVRFSRYATRTLPWPHASSEAHVADLLRIAEQHNLKQWVLFPTDDPSAALLSKFHDDLSPQYRVSTPPWDILRWAYDKRLTYQLAAEQQIDHPWTLSPSCFADLETADVPFPAILKPAVHSGDNRFSEDKAWPVANRAELLDRYRQAQLCVDQDLILVQELIPGGGESQFSFTALCSSGRTIASVTARRTRQYPIDFGHSSCFVETLDLPAIAGPAQRFLAALQYTGLVEVEFKLDARNQRYKLLDVNPRIWTWSPLCTRAGVDYPYLLWQMMTGKAIEETTGRPGARWVRMSTDIPTAWQEMKRGRLTLGAYLHSLRSPIQFALMAADDPLPFLLDLPVLAYARAKKLLRSKRPAEPNS